MKKTTNFDANGNEKESDMKEQEMRAMAIRAGSGGKTQIVQRMTANLGGNMQKFKIDGLTFHAADAVDGVLIDPKLPARFNSTSNHDRSELHMKKWWCRPFVRTGGGFSVYCLDGGAWDRSTWWGDFDTLDGALECAKNGPARRRK